MYKCNYCGRHLKKKYDKCPACGSNSFKKINNIGQYVIENPPKDGYKINIENYKMQKKPGKFILAIGIFILLYVIGFVSVFVFFGTSDKMDIFNIVFIFLLYNTAEIKPCSSKRHAFGLFGLVFLIAGFKTFYDIYKESKKITNPVNRNIKKTKELSKNGILIKNLNYKIKPVDKRIKGPLTVYKIQVLYEVEKGKTKCFESEPKYLTALGRDDGTVDLLLDPNDYNNYFIDFEIY